MSAILKKETVEKETESMPDVRVTSQVAGVGMAVPDGVVTNEHFASYLDTTDQWIEERTGIKERRWASKDMSSSELAEPACRNALKNAGMTPDDIDGIVLATVTPDYIFPSTACFLQHRLGIKKGFAFDVNAVCAGFIYALVTADLFIASGRCQNVLVVGTELYSRIIDPQDRNTCVLFGDGAGAVVLSKASEKEGSSSEDGQRLVGSASSIRGIYASELHSDGRFTDILNVPSGTAKPVTPESLERGEHFLHMNGREVFKLAVRSLVEVSESVLSQVGVSMDDIDYMVSHQANKRILTAVAKQLKLPEEKNLMNVQKYGNTSAASLPILLAESVENGTLKKGDLVLLSAVGGGMTWGAVLLRW